VLGDQRKFAVALVVPDLDAIRKAGGGAESEIQKAVDKVNGSLGSWEQIKKFALVEKDFTIEGGELTPTLKVKRNVVAQKHEKEVDALYA
jgi:long-chain acyl-CoA synthetase